MECVLPSSVALSQPLRGALISVSNNGVLQSGEQMHAAHDSQCYFCSGTTCQQTVSQSCDFHEIILEEKVLDL